MGRWTRKKEPKDRVAEIFGVAVMTMILAFISLLLAAPMVWVLRHVYSWALGT